MMDRWIIWLPYVLIAVIPGIVNLLVAFKQLADNCRYLPFFEPFKTFGVWIWIVLQFSFPSAIFWLTASMQSKPLIDLALIGEATGFGIGFVALMNSKTETGFFTIDIKDVYSRLVRIAYERIAAKENLRTAVFWTNVEQQLKQTRDISNGLDFLGNYFASDVSLTQQQKDEYRSKLAIMRDERQKSKQVKDLLAILDVRRSDLPSVLSRLGCSDDFLQKYFKSWQ